MSNIDAIRNSMSKELSWLNSLMRDALVSESQFFNGIVESNLKGKGKQIRPMLVILGAGVTAEVTDKVILAAAAIELLHNASLIHDDVVDESSTRRGNATINYLWDNQVAVLTGDYFVSRALKCATDTGKLRVVSTLSKLGGDLSLGEIDQLDHARKRDISEAFYFDIISKKTAALFKSCMQVGCYAVDAPDCVTDLLSKYADLLGLCFQIKDDIFDYFDDSKSVGKPTGNDLREGKVTLPLIYALANTKGEERDRMATLVTKPELDTDDINTLIEFAKANGGIEYANEKMAQLRAEAHKLISTLPQCDAIDKLETIFDYIIERTF